MGRASLATKYSIYTLEELGRAARYYADLKHRSEQNLKAINKELSKRSLEPHTRKDP